jgi:hypothetical protein
MGAIIGHVKQNLVADTTGVSEDVAENLNTRRMAKRLTEQR